MADRVIFTHGASGYAHYGCRCGTCRAGVNGYQRRKHARIRQQREAVEAQGRVFVVEGVTHGANAYRNHGCRCEVCVSAKHAQRAEEYRRRRL